MRVIRFLFLCEIAGRHTACRISHVGMQPRVAYVNSVSLGENSDPRLHIGANVFEIRSVGASFGNTEYEPRYHRCPRRWVCPPSAAPFPPRPVAAPTLILENRARNIIESFLGTDPTSRECKIPSLFQSVFLRRPNFPQMHATLRPEEAPKPKMQPPTMIHDSRVLRITTLRLKRDR